MDYKFKTGDRIRLTEDKSSGLHLPFLITGATGTIEKIFGKLDRGPEYFVTMDPVGPFHGDDVDSWVIAESQMEAEDAS